ncbi:MAG: formyltetrahydrofolate-dependent phosphoribosylglycinamide formyltransferase [Verrucomicrobiales bacterium]|jgi:formyltetrahydrofolate-dependent phosphoribosylglycinamide formyltransferase
MPASLESRIMTAEAAAAWRDALDQQGKRVVFTNGCFDLLHTGHVRYLEQARALGDALVVALNSDSSVSALKGPDRPINAEQDRAEVMAALRAVDAVVIFSAPRATALIETIRPHIYAKGGDYTVDSLNPEERRALESCGAEVQILSLVPGRSTTDTVAAMKNTSPEKDLNRPIRLGILGSGKGTNLTGILAAMGAGTLNAQIATVLSDVENSGILTQAENFNLPHAYVDPGEHPNRLADAAQKEIRDRLRAADVDILVLCGFMRILKEPVLSAFAGRAVNTHPSLLPKYPGREAWKQALAAGESETGCTIHLVDAGIDSGEILTQHNVPIKANDTPDALHRRIQLEENTHYPAAIAALWKRFAQC